MYILNPKSASVKKNTAYSDHGYCMKNGMDEIIHENSLGNMRLML